MVVMILLLQAQHSYEAAGAQYDPATGQHFDPATGQHFDASGQQEYAGDYGSAAAQEYAAHQYLQVWQCRELATGSSHGMAALDTCMLRALPCIARCGCADNSLCFRDAPKLLLLLLMAKHA
jgi:hypothetical protein